MRFEIKGLERYKYGSMTLSKSLLVSEELKGDVRLVVKYGFNRRASTLLLTPKQALEVARRLVQIAELSLADDGSA